MIDLLCLQSSLHAVLIFWRSFPLEVSIYLSFRKTGALF